MKIWINARLSIDLRGWAWTVAVKEQKEKWSVTNTKGEGDRVWMRWKNFPRIVLKSITIRIWINWLKTRSKEQREETARLWVMLCVLGFVKQAQEGKHHSKSCWFLSLLFALCFFKKLFPCMWLLYSTGIENSLHFKKRGDSKANTPWPCELSAGKMSEPSG